MAKNTSIKLGDHFDSFINAQLQHGRYSSASEVIRQGLRLLEEHEQKVKALRRAIIEGEESGNDGILDMNDIRLEAKRVFSLLMIETQKSKKARSDLKEIWKYSFDQWGESRADSYYDLTAVMQYGHSGSLAMKDTGAE